MLEIKDLTIQIDDRILIDHQSLSLPDCGLVGIVGKSGCGKTTLLYAISGLLEPSSGEITFDGKKVDISFLKDHTASIRQNYDLIDALNVKDNILSGCLFSDYDYDQDRFNKIVKSLEINHLLSRYPEELSVGQMKRVAIARALLKDVEVLLCDEPTGALHEAQANTIMSLLKEASKDRLVIVVSHDHELLKRYADSLIIFQDSKLLYEPYESKKEEIIHKKKRYSLLPYAFKEVYAQRYKLISLMIFQIIIVTSLLILISGVTGMKSAIDDSVNRAVRKNVVTVSERTGENLSLNYKNARYQFSFIDGLLKEDVEASLYALPISTSHISLEKGTLPQKEDEILITHALKDKFKHDLHYTIDDHTYTFHVTGITSQDFFNRKEIYFTSAFLKKHPSHFREDTMEVETIDVNGVMKALSDFDVFSDTLLEKESYSVLITIGEGVAALFLVTCLISSMMLIFVVFSTTYQERLYEYALMMVMGLNRVKLRLQTIKEVIVVGLVILLAADMITVLLENGINHSSWYNTFHFHFINPVLFTSFDVFILFGILYLSMLTMTSQWPFHDLSITGLMRLLREED